MRYAPRYRRAFPADPNAIVPPALRAAWYRSDSGVTAAGSRVSAWANIWGNGNLAQATGANQPLLVSSAFAGFDGIQSDDGARFMDATLSTPVASGSRCYIWYYGRTDTNAASKRYIQISATGGVAPFVEIRSSSASNLWNTFIGDGVTNDNRNTATGLSTTPALVECGITIGGSEAAVVSGVSTSGTALAVTNAAMPLVSFYSNGAGSAAVSPRATTFEVIIMAGVPDFARRRAMRQYFRRRYGAI